MRDPKPRIQYQREAHLDVIRAAVARVDAPTSEPLRNDITSEVIARALVLAHAVATVNTIIRDEKAQINVNAERVMQAEGMLVAYDIQYAGYVREFHRRYGDDAATSLEWIMQDLANMNLRSYPIPKNLLDLGYIPDSLIAR